MKPLKGLGVAITRPQNQGKSLCEKIEKLGGKAFHFPTLEIVPIHSYSLQKLFKHIYPFRIIFFTSVNAVYCSQSYWQKYINKLKNVKIAAIGTSTRHALENFGLKVEICPKATEEFSSEQLLNNPNLQSIQGERILIIKGKGGRKFLANTLRKKGARVIERVCYKREKPIVDSETFLKNYQQGQIQVLVMTSLLSVYNLISLLKKLPESFIKQLLLLVISKRMQQEIKLMGFEKKPILAKNPTDESIIQALIYWYKNNKWD